MNLYESIEKSIREPDITMKYSNLQRVLLLVGLEEDVNYPLLHGEQASHYTVEYNLPMVVDAGIKEGEKVGELVLKYDGKPVATVPVVARESVKQGFSILSFLLGLVTGFL